MSILLFLTLVKVCGSQPYNPHPKPVEGEYRKSGQYACGYLKQRFAWDGLEAKEGPGKEENRHYIEQQKGKEKTMSNVREGQYRLKHFPSSLDVEDCPPKNGEEHNKY